MTRRPAAGTPGAAVFRRDEQNRYAREIVTPEGVPVHFQLARAGDRLGAFTVDMMIEVGVVLGLAGLLAAAFRGGDSGYLWAVTALLIFLVRVFYFSFFEVRWNGTTPGKRLLGIRVIDARGGQLEASAVLARNFVRELEFGLPVQFLIFHGEVYPNAPGWAILLASAWTFVFLFMPLFNKDTLRIGDLIGGTRVVVQPKVVLAPDLVTESIAPVRRFAAVQPKGPTYEFTDKQLTIYGIYELQVLEGVLRTEPTNMSHFEAIRTVTEKIVAKIRYEGRIDNEEKFLRDFYAALRAHLEQKMLFGQRREDKFSSK